MKKAIVTGAGNGLGADIARALSEAGYKVGVLDFNEADAIAVAAQLDNAVALHADVRDPESVKQAFDQFGDTPDLLVNNAGIVRFGSMDEQSVDDFLAVIKVNLVGSCICSREAGIRMLEQGSGHIVNITSINGVHPAPGTGTYGATKAGLANLTQLMAIEWGPRGVRVNSIAPGFIDGGMSKPIYANPKVREVRGNGVPTRRLGTPNDISQAILFLDSDAASYISGHQLVVDGGVINSVLAQLPRE